MPDDEQFTDAIGTRSEPPANPPSDSDTPTTTAKPRRRRVSKAAAAAPDAATAPDGPAEAPAADVAAQPPAPVKARRTRKAAAAPAELAPAELAPAGPVAESAAVQAPAAAAKPARRRSARAKAADVVVPAEDAGTEVAAPIADVPAADAEAATPAPRRRRSRAAAAAPVEAAAQPADAQTAEPATAQPAAAELGAPSAAESAPVPAAKSRSRRRATAAPTEVAEPADEAVAESAATAAEDRAAAASEAEAAAVPPAPAVLFQAPEPTAAPRTRRRRRGAEAVAPVEEEVTSVVAEEPTDESEQPAEQPSAPEAIDEEGGRRRRRRGRRGRGRGRGGEPAAGDEEAESADEAAAEEAGEEAAEGEEPEEAGTEGSRRRRRRRRRRGEEAAGDADEDVDTVVHVRETRRGDEVRGVTGSTRLEAKRQRRREGRELGRKRPPILSESEFLARREAVERVMVVRQHGERTQIGVLEDGVLVEHYVTRAVASSYVGNVYLGKVQNVLPSMEAAFVDIGKGRNAVLYAGEVNYDASGIEGKPHRIEEALKPGQMVLVQVTKDPIGHKGARLTSQISLPGRYLVYVPGGNMTGISRKLPDTERSRLKSILKKVCPEDAGVIVRTAAEGASEEELTRDVARLQAQWEDIERKAAKAGNSNPSLLYAEPDLVVRVIRDIFNEDFKQLVVDGDEEWATVEAYVQHLAPDLAERLTKWTGTTDVFTAHRIDEQLAKALDRKVWLPSGGSLVIDRTEAMVVIDVNTGKFVGKGGNLEETVTKNNLEAAEEIVRQLRLRDLGGIIVIDFIDMVLESNRDLVLRRLIECLGRDRTKHQVAEVTSLGLVQMTRKRVGTGLLEAFSEPCPECNGRGVRVHFADGAAPMPEPAEPHDEPRSRRRGRNSEAPAASRPAETASEAPAPLSGPARVALATGLARGRGAATDSPPGSEPTESAAADEATAAAVAAGSAVDEDDEEVGNVAAEAAHEVTDVVSARVAAAEAVSGEAVGPDDVEVTPGGRVKRRRRSASRPAGPPAGGEDGRVLAAGDAV